MSTNELVLQNEEQVNAYLESLDKKHESENSGGLMFNEIRIISSDKVQDELGGKPKGGFFIRQKLEDGSIKNTYLGNRCEGVILKNTSQYVYYDELEKRIAYVTNEFERGIEERVSVYSHIQKETVFVGNQKEFKEWAVKHHPDGFSADGNPKNKFKWRTVYYICIPRLIEKNGIENSIFRLYLGVKDLDSIKDFNKALTASPIRFLVEMTTKIKDVGTNRMFPIVLKVLEENNKELLMQLVNAKITLDKSISDYTNSLIDSVVIKQDLGLLGSGIDDMEYDATPVFEPTPTPASTPMPTVTNQPSSTPMPQGQTIENKPVNNPVSNAHQREIDNARVNNQGVTPEELEAIFD